MDFKILGKIRKIRLIAENKKIRILPFLIESYGKGHWRKLSGEVPVLDCGENYVAEVHYYEAPGLGRFDLKIIDKIRDVDKEDLL